jgi:hypothetical protein
MSFCRCFTMRFAFGILYFCLSFDVYFFFFFSFFVIVFKLFFFFLKFSAAVGVVVEVAVLITLELLLLMFGCCECRKRKRLKVNTPCAPNGQASVFVKSLTPMLGKVEYFVNKPTLIQYKCASSRLNLAIGIYLPYRPIVKSRIERYVGSLTCFLTPGTLHLTQIQLLLCASFLLYCFL